MAEKKRVIYYPSLSSGGLAGHLKKKREVVPGMHARFYADDFPEEWRHKYFLATAGHYYKKMNFRKDFGLEDTMVFGDSGGFQIATGAIEWNKDNRKMIFEWLEENSDVAANLDIPPRTKFNGRFHECMDISFDNFKYFEKHQTGKTKFLNVIQGNNLGEYQAWYNKVKDCEFKGWCVGGTQGSGGLLHLMQAFAVFLKNGELDKARNEFIHILGISRVADFFLLATLQKMLNLHFDNRIQLSTDSSSPGQYPVYGIWIHSPNYKTATFTELYIPKGENVTYKDEDKIPNALRHPVNVTFGDVKSFDNVACAKMVMNNLFVYIDTCNQVTDMVECFKEFLGNGAIPKDLYHVMLSIYEMFEASDPIAVYEKYRPLYIKYGGGIKDLSNGQVFNKFFATT